VNSLQDIWREKTDDELAGAACSLDDFTSEAQEAIRAELRRRSIVLPAPSPEGAADELGSTIPNAPPTVLWWSGLVVQGVSIGFALFILRAVFWDHSIRYAIVWTVFRSILPCAFWFWIGAGLRSGRRHAAVALAIFAIGCLPLFFSSHYTFSSWTRAQLVIVWLAIFAAPLISTYRNWGQLSKFGVWRRQGAE